MLRFAQLTAIFKVNRAVEKSRKTAIMSGMGLALKHRIERLHAARFGGNGRGAVRWFAAAVGLNRDHASRVINADEPPRYVTLIVGLLEFVPPDKWPDEFSDKR